MGLRPAGQALEPGPGMVPSLWGSAAVGPAEEQRQTAFPGHKVRLGSSVLLVAVLVACERILNAVHWMLVDVEHVRVEHVRVVVVQHAALIVQRVQHDVHFQILQPEESLAWQMDCQVVTAVEASELVQLLVMEYLEDIPMPE